MRPSTFEAAPLDPIAARRERQRLQAATPWLHDELATQMAQRLQALREPPQHWLDWQPSWGGAAAEAIGAIVPKAQRWVFEDTPVGAATPWWSRWRRSTRAWDGQRAMDMVWANMGLRSVAMPETTMRAWHSALRPGGMLMFSALGPHSLQALRALYAARGWGPPAAEFVDMHDWGDQLLQVGFADPVMDASTLVLSYSSAQTLLDDLRAMGHNTHPERHAACRTRGWRQALLQALEADMPRDAQGRLLLSLEVVWGHAWRGQGARAQAQETAIPVQDMRAMLGRGRSGA